MSARQDFYDAFLKRTIGWQYVSQEQAVTLADLATAQAAHECTGFTSHLFGVDNNAIGYDYYAGSRWQGGRGISKPVDPKTGKPAGYYAHYNTLQDSACELADWVHRRATIFDTIETVDAYAAALKQQKYFEASLEEYEQGMQTYYEPTTSASVAEPLSTLAPTVPDEATGYVLSSSAILVFVLGVVIFLLLHKKNGLWPFGKRFSRF